MGSCNGIGKRLKELRDKANLTQGQLATEMFVKRETIAQWEAETRDIKTEYTVKLADRFGVTCDYILRGIEAENVSIADQIGLSDNAINALRGMTHAAFAERLYYSNVAVIDIIEDILSSSRYYITLLEIIRDGKNVENCYDQDLFYYLRAYYALNKFSKHHLYINSMGEVVGPRSDHDAAPVLQIEVGDVTETALLNKIEDRIKCLKEQFWENNIELSEERKNYFNEKKARIAQEIADAAQKYKSFKEGRAKNGEHTQD